jgi:hypothetical protein
MSRSRSPTARPDAGFAVETVARQFRLAFVPLFRERYDLVVWRRDYFEPPLQKLWSLGEPRRSRSALRNSAATRSPAWAECITRARERAWPPSAGSISAPTPCTGNVQLVAGRRSGVTAGQ